MGPLKCRKTAFAWENKYSWHFFILREKRFPGFDRAYGSIEMQDNNGFQKNNYSGHLVYYFVFWKRFPRCYRAYVPTELQANNVFRTINVRCTCFSFFWENVFREFIGHTGPLKCRKTTFFRKLNIMGFFIFGENVFREFIWHMGPLKCRKTLFQKKIFWTFFYCVGKHFPWFYRAYGPTEMQENNVFRTINSLCIFLFFGETFSRNLSGLWAHWNAGKQRFFS